MCCIVNISQRSSSGFGNICVTYRWNILEIQLPTAIVYIQKSSKKQDKTLTFPMFPIPRVSSLIWSIPRESF